MFRPLKFLYSAIVLMLLCLLCGSAAAESPECTVVYTKDSYLPGETIEAHYSIDYAGGCSALYIEWCILADWDTQDIQPSDSFCETASLEGDLSFLPPSGEGAIPYFTLIGTDGSVHSFWGDPVRVTGSAATKPEFSVIFDQDVYALGETIRAHYVIDFSGAFDAIYAEWNIIADWETGNIQPGNSYQELTELTGDLSFTPEQGEGAVLNFTLIEADGKQHSYWCEPVQVTGSAAKPECAITFDQDVYALGETIRAHYAIDYGGAYTALYAEWDVITDWETGDIQYGGSFSELDALSGDLSFTPEQGEGAVLCLTLIEDDGDWHTFMSDPVQVTHESVPEPVFTVTYSKDVYAPGETVGAHYQILFDGAYTTLYAEWNVIEDWETGDIQPGNSYLELTELEGQLLYTPEGGKGVALYFTLVDSSGKIHTHFGEPVRIEAAPVTHLPGALTAIETEAFAGAGFARVVCPEGLLSIGSRAFSGCASLQSITIPASVQSIAEDAFEDCASLKTIITDEDSAAEAYALRRGYEIRYR